MEEITNNKHIAEQIETECITIESLINFLRTQGDTDSAYNAIIQSIHRLEDLSDFLKKHEKNYDE